jgi:hypothetical protein
VGDDPPQFAEEAAALVLGGVELDPRLDTVGGISTLVGREMAGRI